MTTTFPAIALSASGLGNWAEILRLIGELRGLRDLTSPDGLRQAIEAVLGFAQLVGLDERFIEKLRTILADEQAFEIVLAIVRFLVGRIKLSERPEEGRFQIASEGGQFSGDVSVRSFVDWLPAVLQILDLIRRLLEAF